MFHFLAQKRLERRGFSSGKKRRKTKETAMATMLRCGLPVCIGLFVLFAVLASFWIIFASGADSIFQSNRWQTAVVVGVITVTLAVHWSVSQPISFRRNNHITLMLSVILTQLALITLTYFLMTKLMVDSSGFHLIVLPFVFAPMVVSLLVDRRHATFTVVYTSLLGGLMVPASAAFLFVVFSVICGFVAIYLTDRVRKRSRLVMAGLVAGIACAFLGFVVGQIQLPIMTVNSEATWELAGKQALTAILVSMITAIIVSGMLPLIEMMFRITTDVSWIELADLNHPLLKRMTIEAPGTYHHSLVLATMAETAAEEVGANAVMTRVCAYFHDIGKMSKPEYFVENIGDGINPHDELTPTMSALIVMAHVKDGVDLAIKHKLKKEIIDVIKEHHGKSLVRYFYHRALEQQKEVKELVKESKAREEDIPEVSEDSFRYSGPLPKTKESAIISLADAVESASRSLKKPTPNKIGELIDGIFRDRLLDGQLDRAQLTFDDLTRIKESFYNTIRSMMHNRVEYPELEKEKAKAKVKEKESTDSKKEEAKVEQSEKEGDADKPAKKKGKAGDQTQRVLSQAQDEAGN